MRHVIVIVAEDSGGQSSLPLDIQYAITRLPAWNFVDDILDTRWVSMPLGYGKMNDQFDEIVGKLK